MHLADGLGAARMVPIPLCQVYLVKRELVRTHPMLQLLHKSSVVLERASRIDQHPATRATNDKAVRAEPVSRWENTAV